MSITLLKNHFLRSFISIFILLFLSPLSAQDVNDKEIMEDIMLKTQEIDNDIEYLIDFSQSLLQRNIDDTESFALYAVVLKNMNAFQSIYKTSTLIMLYNLLDTAKKNKVRDVMKSTFTMVLEDVDSTLEDFYKLKNYSQESDNILKRVSRIINNYTDIRYHFKSFSNSLN